MVIFLRSGLYPSELRLGGNWYEYLTFRFIACDLGQTRAEIHMNSRNIVARLNLPNMAHEKSQRVEIYARACEGLVELEKDVEKQKKYVDYIDMYADLTEDELIQYQREYLSSDPQKEGLMGLRQILAEEGRREGLQQGLHEAIELGLSLRFGDKGLTLMEQIRRIEDIEQLYRIKNAVAETASFSEFRKNIEKRP